MFNLNFTICHIVKDIVVTTAAKVQVKSETVNYGTVLTAEELVTNKEVFPDGTTFQFANNSEPKWGQSGSYNDVQITATYPTFDENNKPIMKDGKAVTVTTPVAKCAVAINDSRIINVLAGSTIPDINTVLSLPDTWESHTASWTSEIKTDQTNQGTITIHYPSSNLDQTIKVYVNVIPKTVAINGQNFFTNGQRYDGQPGSIANGENQGAILTEANGQPIGYSEYQKSGQPGQPSTFAEKQVSYNPTYSLSGLQTNADGSLVSGPQTAIVHVSVPKGTFGAQTDASGNSFYVLAVNVNAGTDPHYDVPADVNIAQKVQFEFVEEYNNNAPVGRTYSQEFIPGIATNLTFQMQLPEGYELANGASIPTGQYTLPSFSSEPVVVTVPIHQQMHFNIRFYDEDSHTDLGTVAVSGSTATNGGYDPNVLQQLHFPAGVDQNDYISVSASGVPEGVTLAGNYWGALTSPDTWWWVPNYKWTNDLQTESALCGATMTINLKHKTKETQEQQTRQVVVNYVKAKVNEDGTYTEDGNAFDSAKLDVFYSRTATTDLVTKKVTYSPWLWDQEQGDKSTPGYKVVSGEWTSLPQSWGAVVADVPTLAGYTTATVTDKSGKPANEFVYPSWNTAGQGGNTDPTKESIAYTADAPVYEAQPVHTVLYIPNEVQPRTITAHFKIAGGDRDGQNYAPDAQVQIFFGRTGSLNVNTNKITYGAWGWDTSAGDKATPGFHVISGSWSLTPKDSPSSSWQVNPPAAENGYTMANMRYDSAYSTFTLASPAYEPNTVFTNATDGAWYARNDLTTYYVPNSMVNKTVTRTITINEPGKEPQTITQTANLSRQVRVNADDTGVVYDGFNGSGWSTGNWAAQDVPAPGLYHITVTQTVDGQTTSIELVNGQIPQQTVNSTTRDTAINVTYSATATAKLTGQPSSTYSGQSIGFDQLAHDLRVTVTGPMAGNYDLQPGDVEFLVNGDWTTAVPTNAGTYQVRLTTQGEDNIKDQFGNNSISWEQNGTSTITSDATYTINPAKVTTQLSGENAKVYNGAPVTTADLYTTGSTIKVTINGGAIVNLPASFKLADGDYEWLDADNQAPVRAGTYHLRLTATGITKIQQAINQAVGDSNVVLTTTAANAGTASFTIDQAVAKNVQLYGNDQSFYNGQAVSFNPTAAQGKFGFRNVEGLTIPTFNSADFSWYDADGHEIAAPTDAGTYYLSLNAAGLAAFANANPNYSFTDNGKSTITGQIKYTIVPAELEIGISGTASKVYDGQPAVITQEQIDNGDVKLVWNGAPSEPSGLEQFTLTSADLEVVGADGQPVIHANAGIGADGQPVKGTPYQVRLTAAAFAKIQQLTGAGNYGMSQSNTGNYYIYEHKAELTLSGNQTTVYGTTLPFDPSKYTLTLTNWQDGAETTPILTWRDGKLYNHGQDTGIRWQTGDLYVDGYPNGGVPTDVGTYEVKISAHLTNELRRLFPDYDFAAITDPAAAANEIVKASHTPASYVINPAATTVTINGTEHVKYGEATTINYGGNNGYTISITAPVHSGNVNNDAQPIYTDVHLSAGDLEFVTTPGKVGPYQVKLSEQGLAKLKALPGAKNYDWTQAASARADFYVDQMPVIITVKGEATVTYGTEDWLQARQNVPASYQISVKTESGEELDYQLQAGDLKYVQQPGDVGTYQLALSAAGLAHIKEAFGTNYEYPQSAQALTSTAKLTVEKGNAEVNINGSDFKTYDGSDTLPQNIASQYGLGGLTIYRPDGTAVQVELQPGDIVFRDGATAKNVGTYDVVLSESGKQRIKALDGNSGNNYNWTYNPTATYTIKQATAKAELTGENQKAYDGQPVTTVEIDQDGKIVVKLTLPVYSQPTEPGQEPELIRTIDLGKYILQDGDYTWANGSAPTAVGPYTIKLNDSQALLAHLQIKLTELAGTGQDDQSNVTIDVNDLSGQAEFAIMPEDVTVTITGGAQSKTYDGRPATLDVDGIQITADDGSLNNPGLQASDFGWYDANGQKLDHVPVNVGTYQVRLTESAVQKLQAANPNYHFTTVEGAIDYTITPAEATVTVTGQQKSTTAEIDNQHFRVKVPRGVTVPDDLTYQFVNGTPTQSGTYQIELTPASVEVLKKANPNYDLKITNDATFTLEATLNIIFEDASEGNRTVKSSSETGVANSTIDLNLTIPANYELAPGQTLPTSYTFGKDLQQTLRIKLVHKTATVNPGDQTTNPDPNNPDWFKQHDLVKTVTRTINYEGLTADQLAQIPTSQRVQTVEFDRTATYDLVTGQLVAGSEGPWTAVGDDQFVGFTPHAFAGYTAHPGQVPTVANVVADDADQTLTVTYTRNPVIGTQTIKFVDENGQTISTEAVSGEFGKDVAVHLQVPAGYELAPGEQLPTQVTVENGVTIIKLVKKAGPVNPDNPDQPVNPDHPDNPNNPGQPDNPNNPSNPGQPVWPVIPGTPGAGGHISNDHSISSQLTGHAAGTHAGAGQLPQTGNHENNKAMSLGLIFAGIASALGLAGWRKKKE